MLSQTRILPAVLLLAATAMGARGDADVEVNVEAMIGEATLARKGAGGQQETIVIPTGKVAQNDPGTGQTLLAPATVPNRVNKVVQAIAAVSPDSDSQSPTDDGCSQGRAPHRLTPRPVYDAQAAAEIAAELEGLSAGELMMVMAVLINNAQHLCIDKSTFATAVDLISTERQDEAASVVYVASLLDPVNSSRYADIARKAAPAQADKIDRVVQDAAQRNNPKPPAPAPAPAPKPIIEPPQDIPPGGTIGDPPSPE